MSTFPVFPCDINKIPLIKNWQTLATSDANQIETWRNEFGSRLAYFAIPTGVKSNLLVLDVDVKSGDGFKSIETLDIPQTLWQRTRTGGVHFLFQYPNDGSVYKNRVGLKPSVDVRAEGGYIIWYGSETNLPIAPAPSWLLNEIKSQRSTDTTPVDPSKVIRLDPSIAERIVREAIENVRHAPSGESNNTLNVESYKLGQLVASQAITREYAEQVLFQAAKERGKPDYEAQATIASGIKGGLTNPLLAPLEGAPVWAGPPPPPEPERWTPKKFTRADLLNISALRRPQLFRDWSSLDITITSADGGTGKTTLMLYEAICLALGQPFLGFQCVKPGKTLFITGEDSAEKLGAMIGTIMKQMNIIDDPIKSQVVLDSILVKKDSDLCLVAKDKATGFLHLNLHAKAQVLQAVADFGPSKIIFDPINSFWGSESALNDMNKAVTKFCSQIAHEANCQVEMINHIGKVSSNNKDMGQFAGRGGTGLPSNSRISRVIRGIAEEEYQDLTGETLLDRQSAMLCNVNKFTDGSPLLNKPFIILREGYLFSRVDLTPQATREAEKSLTDVERVLGYVKEQRALNRYPSKQVIVGHFMTCGDPIPEKRTVRALGLLTYQGHMGERLKTIENPDLTKREHVFIVVDEQGVET